jgi:hypothetical protein
VILVVEQERFKGELHARVKFVNRPSMPLKSRLSAAQVKAFYYDAVGHLEVQDLVNKLLAKQKPNGRRYSRRSVKDFFDVFRNMTKDAIVHLKLEDVPADGEASESEKLTVAGPSRRGTLKQPSSLRNAIVRTAKEVEIKKRITPHMMRYLFNDVLRQAGIDKVTRKSLTGHITDEMTEHYSTVQLDEKRAAMEAAAAQLREGKVALSVAPSAENNKAA